MLLIFETNTNKMFILCGVQNIICFIIYYKSLRFFLVIMLKLYQPGYITLKMY